MLKFFQNLYQKYYSYLEYVPIIIIGLLLVAETEMKKKAFHLSFQIIITTIIYTVFFFLILHYGKSKTMAVIVCALLWVSLIYLKNCLLSPSVSYMLNPVR